MSEPRDAREGRALMRRELDEQPELLGGIADALGHEAEGLRPPAGSRVWAGGCGDSLFAAEALAPLFRTAGYGFRAASAAEMLWDGEIAAGDTVVLISISGSTRRTVEALGRAREAGATTVAVTINPDSALAAEADATLRLPYTPVSRAIPHGLDYQVTLLSLAALAGPVAPDVGALFRDETGPARTRAEACAGRLGPDTRFVFLGGGAAARGTAAFAAAKLHEAGGLPAWSFEAENFGHGAQFMLTPGDVVGLFGSGGPADSRTRALSAGLERLGCDVIEAGFAGEVAQPDPLSAALVGGLQAQALCLAVADRLDLDVMNPARGRGGDAVQRDWFGWTAA